MFDSHPVIYGKSYTRMMYIYGMTFYEKIEFLEAT